MLKTRWSIATAVAVTVALAGCAAREQGAEAPAPAAQAALPPPPASSPLAKVKEGMTYQEVMNVLGAPTAQNEYEGGKRWIPFYYGNDVSRTSYFYKGVGRVVFAAGNVFGGQRSGSVVAVEYDPSEPGVAR